MAERKGESLPTLRQVLAGDGAQAPLRQGWLLKEGAVFRRWQRRYCNPDPDPDPNPNPNPNPNPDPDPNPNPNPNPNPDP